MFRMLPRMSLRFNSRWYVWCILVLCILAIPLGLLGRQEDEGLSDDKELDANDLSISFTDRLQVIRLSGLIADRQETSIFGGADGASACLKALRKAVNDKHVKGVLLRINSPGGTVPTSQEIADEVLALRGRNKPVVVSMVDVAASGGYYIACAADKIVAEPGTITGSIGVIFNTMNLKGLADKIGLQPEVIKSGQFKDIGSPFRPMSLDDKAILEGLIADAYDQFVAAVAKGRSMPTEVVKTIADGRIYSGRQAQKLKLVDQLGGYDTAINLLQDLSQNRSHIKHKLPVEHVSADGFFSELRKGLRIGADSLNETSIVGKVFPPFMDAQYYHMPLWIMP